MSSSLIKTSCYYKKIKNKIFLAYYFFDFMCQLFFYHYRILSIFLFCCFLVKTNLCFLDYAHPWQISFQDPGTPIMEGIIILHHDLMFILTIIGIIVSWLLLRTVYLFNYKNNSLSSTVNHGTFIEII